MTYCTAADVTAIVDTDMTDPEIVDLINRTDARIKMSVDYGSLDALFLEDLSSTWTAYRVMLKDPAARRLGEYSENRSDTMKNLMQEIKDMLTLAGGGIAFTPASESLGD